MILMPMIGLIQEILLIRMSKAISTLRDVKDVIIRGGENIPVAEIESLLYKHPNIAMVALVAYPDEQMGEKACAIVKLKEPSIQLSLKDVVDFLKTHQLANQYLPERLEVWNDIPITPSGKIQKFKLRDLLQQSEKV